MRNASRRADHEPPGQEPRRTSFTCACCGREIVTAIEGLFYNPPVGSERRFCDAACRVAAWRRRKAGVPEGTPLQYSGGRSRGLGKGAGPAPVARRVDEEPQLGQPAGKSPRRHGSSQ